MERVDFVCVVLVIEIVIGEWLFGFFCCGFESFWMCVLFKDLDFIYIFNVFDDDLFYVDLSGLVVVFYNFDCNDMKFFYFNGFVWVVDMVDYVCDGLN